MSHFIVYCSVTYHILRKLIFLHEKRCDFFSNTASFLKLEKNPRMTSEKIAFQRDSCGGFSLSSKIKPCLKKITPPYFCDMCYFRKVGLLQIYFLNTFLKKIIELVPFLSSFLPDLLVSIFKIFKKKTFSAPFWHFSQKFLFYPYFRVKQPYRTKIPKIGHYRP